MSTLESSTPLGTMQCSALKKSVARKSTTKLPQNWLMSRNFKKSDGDSVVKADSEDIIKADDGDSVVNSVGDSVVRTDGDSGVGSSDSSDSNNDIKESFKETFMNLKALNGDTQLDANSETKPSDTGSPEALEKITQTSNGSIQDTKVEDTNGIMLDEEENKLQSDSPLPTDNGEKRAESPDLTVESLEQLSPKMAEGGQNIVPNLVVAVTETLEKVVSKSEIKDVEETVAKKSVIDVDDDDVMILSDSEQKEPALVTKPERSDPAHPLTIGDKVRNSVRDIMSKLAQGKSPELNKLLVKAKPEENMEVDLTDASSSNTAEAEESKLSVNKGNLFENLTGLKSSKSKDDALAESEVKLKEDSVLLKEDTNLDIVGTVETKRENSADVNDVTEDDCKSSESDIEFIDESEIDKNNKSPLFKNEEKGASNDFKCASLSDQIQGIKKESESEVEVDASDTDITRVKTDTVVEKEECDSKIDLDNVEEKMEVDSKDTDADTNENVKSLLTSSEKDIKSVEEDSQDKSDSLPVSNDRKRSPDSVADHDGDQLPPKRSRLDMVIGKLGSQIGISPDTLESSSESEDSRHSDSSENKSEDNTSSITDEDDDKTSQSSTKTVRLTSKELEALVRSKVAGYLKTHRDAAMVQLQKKIEELQATNESWKNQSKELQRQVLDLTVLQQRLEKRKAATAALRQITTRSVGIQVDENKTAPKPATQMKTPPKQVVASSMTTAQPAPLFTRPAVTATNVSRAQGVVMSSINKAPVLTTSSLGNTILARNSVSQLLSATAVPRTTATSIVGVTSPPVLTGPGARPQLAQHLTTSTTVRSLLDTVRADPGKVQSITNPAGTNLLVVSAPTAGQANTKTLVTTPKIIDLTADEDQAKAATLAQAGRPVQIRPGIVPQVIRQVGPLQQATLPGGTSILLSSAAGTQIVNNTQNINRPGGSFQVVTIASTPNLRPGTLLTVVPAVSTNPTTIRPGTTASVAVSKPIAQPMPQLRPAQLINHLGIGTTVRPSTVQQTIIRPPPPLQSAPVPQPGTTINTTVSSPIPAVSAPAKHPAPLPAQPTNQQTRGLKGTIPPKPGLKISRVSQGIVLSWNMTVGESNAEVASYQLFAYQESSSPPSTSLWKKVGDVKALPLPMACTLTQFQEGNKYHFAVRAVDTHGRQGEFSDPSTIHLTPKT